MPNLSALDGGEAPFQIRVGAEQFEYDSAWTSEAYGSDAMTPLAWIAAVQRDTSLSALVVCYRLSAQGAEGLRGLVLNPC